ncbi:MAG: family 10 glycosylhydrolase [Candidatus Omnitrophica bacterium]|nr:family 10 glycosylhydrolase [Candidatus Omnitrophota bacterium]MDD5500151.1 family 10 glycosylhydrolase [Candidatus Omnitrophota bacterium]
MRRKIPFLLLACLFFIFGLSYAQEGGVPAGRGVWISVFSSRDILYSREGVSGLISKCKQAKINEIYLQFFQSGNAYYDSSICDKSKYEEMVKASGIDSLDLLIREAQENNIKVFAWINVLSLGKNEKADILNKYGESILTLDQYQRGSMIKSRSELDKYYLREDQIFLEPGDPRIESYMLTVVNEIINRYPLLSGVHLDYIRYPSPVPFIPGSRFKNFGLVYGYGPKNVERFREKTGLNPLENMNNEYEYLAWDNWKRQQVTNLVRKISNLVKVKSPDLEVSCAVIPFTERAYSNAFQDWSDWLQEGIVDYVVMMSYTRDNQMAKEIVKSGLGQRGKGRVYVGIGLFLMKGNPDLFLNQYRMVSDLSPDGIVFFSIDDLNDKIIGYLN